MIMGNSRSFDIYTILNTRYESENYRGDAMLIEFKTENYRSFGDERKMSMRAGSSRIHGNHVVESDGMCALVFSAVFGANASGKSNLVRAMRDSRERIVNGIPIPRTSWNRMDAGNEQRPTGFEYVFTTGGRILVYGFEVIAATGVIDSEWLYDLTVEDECVFERTPGRIVTDLRDSPGYGTRLDVLEGLVGEGSRDLLLPILVKMSGEDGDLFRRAREAMSWFDGCLVVTAAGESIPLSNDPDRDSLVRGIMTSYDTGITGMGYEEVGYESLGFPRGLRGLLEEGIRNGGVGMVSGPSDLYRLWYDGTYRAERVVFEHDGRRFGFGEESDGTQRLYGLLPILEPGAGDDMTYVVDELDRSLHPLMTERFVRDFLGMAKGCRRQLIITTHESKLQNMELLRRDEIWYVQRGLDGSTDLYSLEEFKERVDRRVERAYLDGRYGAVPRFDRQG